MVSRSRAGSDKDIQSKTIIWSGIPGFLHSMGQLSRGVGRHTIVSKFGGRYRRGVGRGGVKLLGT